MAKSLAARCGLPGKGGVRAVMASQVVQPGKSASAAGASGRAMQGRPAGMPPFCRSQVSSLPMNSRLASQWRST